MVFRRKRGAQPGNYNARKHGFYSAALSPRTRKVLREAQKVDAKELAQEIALLRACIFRLQEAEPENLQVLILALRQLSRMVAINFHLSRDEEHAIHESLHDLVRSLQPQPA